MISVSNLLIFGQQFSANAAIVATEKIGESRRSIRGTNKNTGSVSNWHFDKSVIKTASRTSLLTAPVA
jgi:hypothetical protein